MSDLQKGNQLSVKNTKVDLARAFTQARQKISTEDKNTTTLTLSCIGWIAW